MAREMASISYEDGQVINHYSHVFISLVFSVITNILFF
jgi:hypothetical protein